MKKDQICSICNNSVEIAYNPMDEWNIKGMICGKCYSSKIAEFYPGKHERVNLSND